MKKIYLFLAVLAALVSCATTDERNAQALAERIVPGYKIDFVQIEDSEDVFEIETVGSRLIIRGNNANSMAVGLSIFEAKKLIHHIRKSISIEVLFRMPLSCGVVFLLYLQFFRLQLI